MGDVKSVFIVLAMLVIGLAFIAAFAPHDEFVFTCGNHSSVHTASLSGSGSTMQLMQEMTEEHGCSGWRVTVND